jgi:hypothetical protein
MGVQGIGPLAFTGAEAAQLQGSAIAEWGASKKGWKTCYLLLDSTVEYNKSVCYSFELGLKARSHWNRQRNDDHLAVAGGCRQRHIHAFGMSHAGIKTDE